MANITIILNDAQTAWATGIIVAADPAADIDATLTALATDSLVAVLTERASVRATATAREAENDRRKAEDASRLEAFPKTEEAKIEEVKAETVRVVDAGKVEALTEVR